MTGKSNELDEHLAAVVKGNVQSSGAGTVTPDLQDGGLLVLTCTAATITIGAPLFRGGAVSSDVIPTGTLFILRLKNTSGGVLTPTLNAIFKVIAVGTIASAQSRTWGFVFDGTNWFHCFGSVAAADVAN
jgi:hypothetical protein